VKCRPRTHRPVRRVPLTRGSYGSTEAPPAKGARLQQLPHADVSRILGKEVRSASGEAMGRIVDVLVDETGRPRAAVVDFGGFLGVGTRKIATG